MRSVYFSILLIHVACGSIAQSVPQQPYTLHQILAIALANNLQVKQSELSSQIAAVNLSQARANLLPDISANINHGLNQGRSIDPFTNSYANQNINYANYSLNGGIVLFNGLIQRNLIKQSLLTYQASKMAQQQAKDELTLNVIFTYFQILNNEDQLKQAELQAGITLKQVERSKLLSKEGAIAPSQLSDLMGQLANDELSLINSRNNLSASKIGMVQLMNVSYNKDFKVERQESDILIKQYNSSPETVYALALEQLALIKGAILRKESAEKGIKVARGARLPQLSLSSNVYSNYSSAAQSNRLISSQYLPSDDYIELNGSKLPVIIQQRIFENNKIAYNNQIKNNYSSSFSVGLRIPILNSLRTRNQVALAKIEMNNAELAEESIKVQLKQAIALAWLNMISASERVKTLTSQVNSFKESFHATEVRFNAGAGTVVDYTIAKNNLDKASINLINARYDYFIRNKVLDYYQGKLTFD